MRAVEIPRILVFARSAKCVGGVDLDSCLANTHSVKVLLFLLFALLPRVQAAKPNVVILFTDDQGTLDAGCYGAKHLITPNIDKLAATGVKFTQAYAHTVCCPARAALLTGRHPQRGGVVHWTQGDMNAAKGINMAPEEVTLAEALKPAGYRTGLFGKWHLGAHKDYGPKKQGFDEFFGIRDGFIDNYNHYFLHPRGFHDLYEGTKTVKKPGEYFPELMVKRSLKFIEENKESPFFLCTAFNIPHYPEQALKKHEALFKNEPNPELRSYGAIMATTDYYVGQIVDKLEEYGLRENTILIFMSDNGHSEETGNKIRNDGHLSGYPKGHFYGASGGGYTGKWIGQKGSFLEGGVRVPAIVSFPAKFPKGVARDQIMTAMDWFPTVLDLCGVKQAEGAPKLDGHNLLPLIEKANAPSKYQSLFFAWGTKWAVREGDWKLIGSTRNENVSLHNLAEEKPEVKNHAKEKPEKVSQLRALYSKWAEQVKMKW